MKKMNVRFMLTGLLMIMLAIGFFVVMLDVAPKSNDPAEVMRIVGMVSGVVGALGLVLSVLGTFGVKAR